MNAVCELPPASIACATVRRKWFALCLFRIVRPWTAKAAAVDADTLRLLFRARHREIPLGDIESVELKAGRCWGRISIRHASGRSVASGLPRKDAQSFVKAVEAARAEWWHRELAKHAKFVEAVEAAKTKLWSWMFSKHNELVKTVETAKTRLWRWVFAKHSDQIRTVHERVIQLKNPPRYITRSLYHDLKHKAREVSDQLPSRWPDTLSRDAEVRMLKTVRDFLNKPDRQDNIRRKANKIFVENELNRCREFFDQVEAHPLTDEQRRAIITDEDRNQVIAAAGSGKTSVIVAKVGWIARRSDLHPSELLLLAFTRAAQGEITDRIRDRFGDEVANDVTLKTFHGLGMSIIGQAEGRRPSLHESAEDPGRLADLLNRIISELTANDGLLAPLVTWFQSHFAPYKSEHEFKNWGQYWAYIMKYEIRSLKGEKVKSFGECEIANFLFLNGVPYKYEADYEHDTATRDRRQYQPDFYLPEAGIYIEHFGIDASGNPPPGDAPEEYLASMRWKRWLHQEHGTTLIETFSHELSTGVLTENLAQKLTEHGVSLSLIPRDEFFATINEQNRINPFIRLVATFLQHYKGVRQSFEEVTNRAQARDQSEGCRQRAGAFLKIFKPVFERYQETLQESGKIDFHDMINRATELVEEGSHTSSFGYILVDEFQDISQGRAKLLEALLNQSRASVDRMPPTQLLAVGDDWQAIYRFAGSDISVMREFRERFGDNERIDLETTFRCAEPIATTATKFILANPAQISKEVRSTRQAQGTCIHIGLPDPDEDTSLLDEALKRIAVDAARHEGPSSVLLLGRYKHLKPQNLRSLSGRHHDLKISFKTVHSSKGLEADYVIVLGLCSGKYGFPSEITDDPLLDLVLPEPERHPNAEERRLFYVAMTRAKRHVFLLAEGEAPSSFITELLKGDYDVDVFGRPPGKDVACPTCVEGGRLVLRRNAGNGGMFYGCSNYSYCTYTQPACSGCEIGLPIRSNNGARCRECGERAFLCPRCGGWLRRRDGQYGPFLGCTNYPQCTYTRNLPPE